MSSYVCYLMSLNLQYKFLRPTSQAVKIFEVGLRMTLISKLFLCRQPLHVVILRPTLII
jgi:hypothetical protein